MTSWMESRLWLNLSCWLKFFINFLYCLTFLPAINFRNFLFHHLYIVQRFLSENLDRCQILHQCVYFVQTSKDSCKYWFCNIRELFLFNNHPSQHFNVGPTLFQRWVEITLVRSWKWNKIRRRIFNFGQRWYNVGQRWYNVGVWRWNNVGTTLIQLYLNFVPTWPQP